LTLTLLEHLHVQLQGILVALCLLLISFFKLLLQEQLQLLFQGLLQSA